MNCVSRLTLEYARNDGSLPWMGILYELIPAVLLKRLPLYRGLDMDFMECPAISPLWLYGREQHEARPNRHRPDLVRSLFRVDLPTGTFLRINTIGITGSCVVK